MLNRLSLAELIVMMSVADPGFPRGGGANPKGGGRQPIISPIFPENCMKMKKFWARGGREGRAPPLRSATGCAYFMLCGVLGDSHFKFALHAFSLTDCDPFSIFKSPQTL